MRVLYLGQKPAQRTGSPIILRRHLIRLADQSHELVFGLEWGQAFEDFDPLSRFQSVELPHRLWWWPPYRRDSDFSRSLQTRLWCRYLAAALPERPDVILTYMAWHDDLFAEIGGRLGKLWNIRTVCLVHDDAVAFQKSGINAKAIRRRQKRILKLNSVNAFVSDELREDLPNGGGQSTHLWPIPAGSGPCRPAPKLSERFQLYFAGYCWPSQAHLLIRLNHWLREMIAEVVVVGAMDDETRRRLGQANVRCLPMFATNDEAIDHLSHAADGLIVSYADSSQSMPWITTSFPSKLIEYSHLGLPIVVVAPEDASVTRWCRSQSLCGIFEPYDKANFQDFVQGLMTEAGWVQSAQQWLKVANGPWSPERIQAKFEAMLFPHNSMQPSL